MGYSTCGGKEWDTVTNRETPLQKEISLINVTVSHQKVTYTVFRAFFFFLNNQLKIINRPKRCILGWYILLPFKAACGHLGGREGR